MVFVSIYNITEPCEGAVGGRFASYGLQLFTTVLLRVCQLCEGGSSVRNQLYELVHCSLDELLPLQLA